MNRDSAARQCKAASVGRATQRRAAGGQSTAASIEAAMVQPRFRVPRCSGQDGRTPRARRRPVGPQPRRGRRNLAVAQARALAHRDKGGWSVRKGKGMRREQAEPAVLECVVVRRCLRGSGQRAGPHRPVLMVMGRAHRVRRRRRRGKDMQRTGFVHAAAVRGQAHARHRRANCQRDDRQEGQPRASANAVTNGLHWLTVVQGVRERRARALPSVLGAPHCILSRLTSNDA